WKARLGHVEATAEVDAYDRIPILETHLEQRAVARDAGVVDQHVDRSDFLRHAAATGERGCMIANIPFVCRNAGLLGEGARLFVIAGIVRGDRQALGLKRLADRPADAACAPGDDCNSCHDLSSRAPAGPMASLRQGPARRNEKPRRSGALRRCKRAKSEAELGPDVDGLAVLLGGIR